MKEQSIKLEIIKENGSQEEISKKSKTVSLQSI
jgi:hypothetical protein